MIPWPLSGTGTGPYLALYVLTLALHAALIGYVLAGTGYAAVAAIRRADDPIADAARDWLPFYLGAAITAGVAPLVFVQMLYQERFYTADLLAGPRWLAIVPALVIGFYALYVHKTAAPGRRRLAAIAVAAMCFGFVAWSWTEHHLLMVADDARWHAFYAGGERFYLTASLAPRVALWLASALPLFAVIAAWQLGPRAPSASASPSPAPSPSPLTPSKPAAQPPARRGAQPLRSLAIVALVGVVASSALALAVRAGLDPASRAGVDAAAPWLIVLVAGRVVEAGGWLAIALRPTAPRVPLALATGGASASLLAGVVLREAARIHLLAPARPSAVAAGGAVAFAIVLIVVIAAMAWIARLVQRAKLASPEPPPPPPDSPD